MSGGMDQTGLTRTLHLIRGFRIRSNSFGSSRRLAGRCNGMSRNGMSPSQHTAALCAMPLVRVAPNYSIERTSPGKPVAASHVKR
jgi:hypothetical protein